MASIDIGIDLMCDDCRASLDVDYRDGTAKITPCKNCLKSSYDEGYEKGSEDATE